MTRGMNDNPPSADPTRDDVVRAAAVFDMKGRYWLNGTRLYLIMTLKDTDETPTTMMKFFGGSVNAFGRSRRWVIGGPRMHAFIEQIYPFLTEPGRATGQKIVAADALLDNLDGDQIVRRLQARNIVAAATAPRPSQRQANPIVYIDLHLSMEDDDQLEVIPTLLEDKSPLVCSAPTEADATSWLTKILTSLPSLTVRQDGVLLHVNRPLVA